MSQVRSSSLNSHLSFLNLSLSFVAPGSSLSAQLLASRIVAGATRYCLLLNALLGARNSKIEDTSMVCYFLDCYLLELGSYYTGVWRLQVATMFCWFFNVLVAGLLQIAMLSTGSWTFSLVVLPCWAQVF
ncbi:hypothetical protein H5410_055996 [Solanum commersonii]|uniref:Uncharacterized protein n=1 Tax=Solanum commersonii TaxID=4109 RepID=A0A9J5WLV8_SOLCO|nr:hypothetical protein H5410_055996 [Solanum commersonii]